PRGGAGCDARRVNRCYERSTWVSSFRTYAKSMSDMSRGPCASRLLEHRSGVGDGLRDTCREPTSPTCRAGPGPGRAGSSDGSLLPESVDVVGGVPQPAQNLLGVL